MENLKTKAIVLNSKDYKDKDKLIELFTLTSGKITAKLKGCVSPKSKLKFASQPFCFAEFILNRKGDNYIITNVTEIDSFFNIVNNTDKYIYGALLLELANKCSFGEDQCYKIFLDLLNALKCICYENIKPALIVIKYCLNLLDYLGYNLQFKVCNLCKLPFLQDINLDLDSGEFLCGNCKSFNCINISKSAFNNMRLISDCDMDILTSLKIKDEFLKEIINILIQNFEFRLFTKLNVSKFLN